MKKFLLVLSVFLCFACANKPQYANLVGSEFENAPFDGIVTPQIYAIAATRSTNKMLDETRTVYENLSAPFLYVMEIKKEDENVPDGLYYANKVTKDIITNSRTFRVVQNMNDADYFLETIVGTYTVNEDEPPVIVYKMILFDNKNVKINEWSETISRLKNDDKSWW